MAFSTNNIQHDIIKLNKYKKIEYKRGINNVIVKFNRTTPKVLKIDVRCRSITNLHQQKLKN